MQEEQVETVLLYTLEGDKNTSKVRISFQVYPGAYDFVTIVHKTRKKGMVYYELDRLQMPEASIDAYDYDAILITVWSNGVIYAGGIWQVMWSQQSKQLFLRCFSATSIELVYVTSLLSTEERGLIEDAISAAFDFWKKQFPDAIFMFITCEEVSGNMIDQHQKESHEGKFDVKREMTWRITLHGFTDEGPNPTICRAFVHYHPELQAEPFTLEII